MVIFEIIKGIFLAIGILLAISGLFSFIGWSFRKGWDKAEDKTKRVCDMCFREIKKFNEENNSSNN